MSVLSYIETLRLIIRHIISQVEGSQKIPTLVAQSRPMAVLFRLYLCRNMTPLRRLVIAGDILFHHGPKIDHRVGVIRMTRYSALTI